MFAAFGGFLYYQPSGPAAGVVNFWTWGLNSYGQSGLGDTSNRSAPVQVGSTLATDPIPVTLSSRGAEGALVKSDGTLWAWGNNTNGQLGLNDVVFRSSPVQVGSLTNWSKVYTSNVYSTAITYDYMMAIKTDGTLWLVGSGAYGQMGTNDRVSRSSPIQLGTLTTWASGSVGGAQGSALAITTDGNLYAWGGNSSGLNGTNASPSVIIARSTPVQVPYNTGNWASVQIGGLHAVGIGLDGSLWTWGYNAAGQLGDTTATARSFAAVVGALKGWASGTAGSNTSAAIRSGSLYTWGQATQGQLGTGSTTNTASPAAVGALTTWQSVSMGSLHGMGLLSDGTLWTWGANNNGQLGVSSTVYRSSPVSVASSSWARIGAGYTTSGAISNSGLTVPGIPTNVFVNVVAPTSASGLSTSMIVQWTPPTNDGGTTITSYTITASPGGTTYTSYAPKFTVTGLTVGTTYTFTVAATNRVGTGTSIATSPGTQLPNAFNIWMSGINSGGQLGNGTTALAISPVQTQSTYITWSNVSAGNQAYAGVMGSGQLYTWGISSQGQSGIGTVVNNSFLAQVGSLTTWNTRPNTLGMDAQAFALTNAGALFAWGNNSGGQLGNNTVLLRSSPVQVGALTDWYSVFSGDAGQFFGIKIDGSLWGCGLNTSGLLGDGTIVSKSSPVQLSAPGNNWLKLQTGASVGGGIKTDGTVWCWGTYCGQNDAVLRSSPVQVGGAVWTSLGVGTQQCLAVRTDGTLWTWGSGSTGSSGLNNTAVTSSPTQIGALTNWQYALGGSGALMFGAIKSDGTMWVWGDNSSGQLGDNTATTKSSPVQIGAGPWSSVPGTANFSASNSIMLATTKVTPIAPANCYVAILGSTATVYFRIPYFDGGFPITSYTATSYPGNITSTVAVSAITFTYNSAYGGLVGSINLLILPNIPYVFTVYASNSLGAGAPSLPSNSVTGVSYGGLYTWGLGTSGQLGDSTVTSRSSPAQIGADTIWNSLGSAPLNGAGIKSDNTLWTWGSNTNGSIGDNTVTFRSSPVQIAGTTWSKISRNSATNNFLATKTDGTLWSWGVNSFGQLGLNDAAARSSPVQIGAGTTWLSPFGGYYGSAAIKTDGTLWTWGYNGAGNNGVSDTIVARSSPIQVGILTNWKSVTSGRNFTIATKTDGTLWGWGANTYGSIGDGTVINRSSPSQIAGATWSSIAASVYSAVAIQTDGTLWTWGNGTGTQIEVFTRSSPIQIASGKIWSSMATFTAIAPATTGGIQAIDSTGKLWTWGYNTDGAWGTNQAAGTSSTSPIQVGLLTTWKQVAGQSTSFIAIQ